MAFKRKMTKRYIVRIASFVCGAFVALFGWGVVNYNAAQVYKLQLENYYSSALTDLSNYLTNINFTLEKELYAGTPTQLATLSAQLWKESGAAKASISQLPIETSQTKSIFKFLSQVGDYSLTLSRKVSGGGEITEVERDNLKQLKNYAQQISDSVSDMQAMMSEGDHWSGEVKHILEQSEDQDKLSALNQSVEDITQTETSYPTLIYDGPFSDHIDQQTPQLTKGKASISVDKAREIAAGFLDCNTDDLILSNEEESVTSAFVFAGKGATIAITKLGGYCLYMNKTRNVASTLLSENEAINKARTYLKNKLEMNFIESYYITNENICVVNLAYSLDGIICYSDLIKVGVAMDNGEIMSIEARGFIMNHRQRENITPTVSIETAKEVLSPLLTVESVNTAIINSGGLKEHLCYEFVCKGEKDEDILVYVNAKNLEEENILILLKTDGGILTK
ncbi:MAG: germination protein YpeB [Clostridia bacterium]|nr:germination protein YpeB [Clostridia bacterium]